MPLESVDGACLTDQPPGRLPQTVVYQLLMSTSTLISATGVRTLLGERGSICCDRPALRIERQVRQVSAAVKKQTLLDMQSQGQNRRRHYECKGTAQFAAKPGAHR